MPAYTPDKYVAALRFAAEAHLTQREPGSELPYLVHVVSVAAEVIAVLPDRWAPGHDLAVQCALLHDTVEDTETPLSALAERFGDEVARGVDALSKRADLPKDQQMDDSLERILRCPPEVAWVKLADRATNLSEPPHYWSAEKCTAYRAEAERILAR
jgi:(p)ppGpp synthase/HD superfamily hydrolase